MNKLSTTITNANTNLTNIINLIDVINISLEEKILFSIDLNKKNQEAQDEDKKDAAKKEKNGWDIGDGWDFNAWDGDIGGWDGGL